MKKIVLFVIFFLLLTFRPVFAQNVVVAYGSTWKYLDDGQNQGINWQNIEFDDSEWSSGSAPLGYGYYNWNTEVSYGNDPNNKYITTYFRYKFEVSDPTIYSNLNLKIRRDDGAVVYLNEEEVLRTNMPEGTISSNTLASIKVSPGDPEYDSTFINGNNLNSGWNVLAVEIHQFTINSGDIIFDLELKEAAEITLISPMNNTVLHESFVHLEIELGNFVYPPLTIQFFIRDWGTPFRIIGLPDTQHYSGELFGGLSEMYYSQTQWIKDNRNDSNVVYVSHFGDVTQNGDYDFDHSEWIIADSAMSILESKNIPYGVLPGDHDQTEDSISHDPQYLTVKYNNYFGINRFQCQSWYGNNYGSNNDNHYDIFSAGGMDFIVVNLEDAPRLKQREWAHNILNSLSERKAILVSHDILNNDNDFSNAGDSIFEAVKSNENLFLMLSGHRYVNGPDGEFSMDTVGTNGNTIYCRSADYQNDLYGGNGWLRIMEFDPPNNKIWFRTYSPWIDSNPNYGSNPWRTDSDSQFNVDFSMGGHGVYSSECIISHAFPLTYISCNKDNLINGKTYEWYVKITDSIGTNIESPHWKFYYQTLRDTIQNTSFVFNSKIYLEGCYDIYKDSMNTYLNAFAKLPLQQPFNISPWNYDGQESVSTIPEDIVDWILVELRTEIQSSSKVAQQAAFLRKDGLIVSLDGFNPLCFCGLAPTDYYLVIYHRNHIKVMSSSKISMTN
ncbi:MAG: metallophosphoesterase [Melioribacteraceae bacterium]